MLIGSQSDTQWGYSPVPSGSWKTITFPIAFTTAVYSVTTNASFGNPSSMRSVGCSYNGFGKTSFLITGADYAGWIAVGV